MNKSELPFLTASDLSKLMAAKEVSPVEATEAYLDRIEALDAKYRAYVTVAADAALVRNAPTFRCSNRPCMRGSANVLI